MNPFSIIENMKNVLKLFIPLMAITLVSCGGKPTYVTSGSSLIAKRTLTSTSIYYSCEKDNRDTTYTFTVKSSHAEALTCEYHVDIGAITMSLADDTGNVMYADIIVEDMNYTIPFKGAGKYKLKVHTDDFKGTYLFKWSK